MPRRYTLGKRSDAKAETRERIVAATLRLYREGGLGGASVAAVARAADVAPATVRNHFPGPNDLAEAAADGVLTALAMPEVSIFDGASGPTERVRRLVTELAAFYERGTEWWEIRQRDRDLTQAWAGAEARYEQRLADLVRAAVAPLDDPVVVAVTGTAVGSTYFALRAAGQTPGDAVETVLEVLLPWLERRGP